MGDFNGDEKKFGPLKQIPNMTWVISGVPTNTRRTETYDNILFDRAATVEFTGRAGVFDLVWRVQSHRATGARGFRPLPHLGRIQLLRRWPTRPRGESAREFAAAVGRAKTCPIADFMVVGQFNFKRVAVVERSEPTAGKFRGLGGTRPRPAEIFESN